VKDVGHFRKISSNEDDFDLKYDSDSIKSTESIHEARRKIENPRKIISLLNSLNQINLNDPIEKAEFLKNMIDFEEKYGKLDEEEIIEEGHTSKRSKDSNLNTDRQKNQDKKSELPEEKKNGEEIKKAVIPEVSTNKQEEIVLKQDLNILEKLDNLKKNYDEFMNIENVALETISLEQNQHELEINRNILQENIEKDLLFLTNPADLLKTDSSKRTGHTNSTPKEEAQTQKTLKSWETQGNKENSIHEKEPKAKNEKIEKIIENSEKQKESVPSHKKDKSISRIQEQDSKKTKESFHSKASKISKNSKDSKVNLNKEENKDFPDETDKSEDQSQKNEKTGKSEQKNVRKSLMGTKPAMTKVATKTEIHSPGQKIKSAGLKKKEEGKAEELEVKENSTGKEEIFQKTEENEENEEKDEKKEHKKNKSKDITSKSRKKMPTLDLDSIIKKEKSEREIKIDGETEENEQNVSKLEGSYDNLSKTSEEEMNKLNDVKEKRQTISEETERKAPMGTIYSSRNEFDSSKNLEDDYEMIEEDILDEDLEVLIKTSEKNEVLNEFKTEEAKEEMKNVRQKLIKKLEKKFGKKNLQKKLKKIEKNIEQASKIEKVKIVLIFLNFLDLDF